jgi:hypothetical protein
MSDDQEPPRTQQSAHASVVDAVEASSWKSGQDQDWQHSTSRDGFSNSNTGQLPKTLPSNPFAFSTDGLATHDDEAYSTSPTYQQMGSRAGLDTGGSDERDHGGLANRSSDDADDSLQQHHHLQYSPKTPKVEDISHSIFYDDTQYQGQSRREQGDNDHDEEVTSDEEEAQYADQFPSSCSAPQFSASSFGSPRQHSNVAPL